MSIISSIMLNNKADEEIERLTNLKKGAINTFAERNVHLMMMNLLMPNDEYLKEKRNLITEYHKNLFKFLDTKIEFWKYVKLGKFPKNFIDTLNETMNDWLLSGWEYIGMKNHREDAKGAKDEFEFFKTIINSCGVIQDKKKPTRRGGKNKKKN